MRKTVVFILSSNFSGSHFLSLLLGSHSRTSHLGEIKNLIKIKNTGQKSSLNKESSRQCYICEKEPECQITANLYNLQPDEIYPELFARHNAVVTHLIDASKKTTWAKKFSSTSAHDIKYIHLIRDPRALKRKWDLHYSGSSNLTRQKIKQVRNYPSKVFEIIFRSSWQTYTLKWVTQNRKIHEFITASNHDHQIITYEELASNPITTVSSIMDWLTLDFEPTQINYWEHEHHGTQKQKYNTSINGNNNFIDTRWKEDVSLIEQTKIITSTDILKLTSELGLNITEQGLVKCT